MSRKRTITRHQELLGCVDERETLEQAETALREALSKSFCNEAPDELLDAVDTALVAVQKRLSDIRLIENELYEKLGIADQTL